MGSGTGAVEATEAVVGCEGVSPEARTEAARQRERYVPDRVFFSAVEAVAASAPDGGAATGTPSGDVPDLTGVVASLR